MMPIIKYVQSDSLSMLALFLFLNDVVIQTLIFKIFKYNFISKFLKVSLLFISVMKMQTSFCYYKFLKILVYQNQNLNV